MQARHVLLQSAALTVEISAMGAQVLRVEGSDGHPWLWDGDPAYWTGRSPVLFPVAGVPRAGGYAQDGVRYALGKHGFARDSLFEIEAERADAATFLLSDATGRQAGFPFAYSFRVRYALMGNRLQAEYIIENHDTRAFYCSAGAHEAYACPEGIEAYGIEFPKDTALENSVLEGPYLTARTEEIALEGHMLPLRGELFAHDTLVLASLASRSVTLKSRAHGRQVHVDFADFPYLLVWTVLGAGFVCIEPWHNLPDALDAGEELARKPGMIRLEPGARRVLSHTVTFADEAEAGQPLRIVRAGLGDAQALGRMHSLAWRGAYTGLVPGGYLEGFTPRKRAAYFERMLDEGRNEQYLLYWRGEACGMLALGPAAEPGLAGCGEVHALYLLPAFYRRGIGRAAMDFALARLGALGLGDTVLTVLSGNERARAFYGSLGFVPDGEEEEIELGEVLMERRYRLAREE